jgi:hypothetical protein
MFTDLNIRIHIRGAAGALRRITDVTRGIPRFTTDHTGTFVEPQGLIDRYC